MIPYQKWHSVDWMASSACRVLNYEEKGVYRELLDIAWIRGPVRTETPPYLPDDVSELAYLLNITEEVFLPIWKRLERYFERTPEGLCSPRQMQEFESAMKVIETRRKSGRKGGSKSRPRKAKAKHMLRDAKQMPSKTEAKPSYPDPDSSPTESIRSKSKSEEETLEKKTSTDGETSTAPARGANPAVAVGGNSEISPEPAKTALKTLKESDRGRDRPRSEPQPLGGMLGGRPKDRGSPVNGERLADWILAAWSVGGFNGSRGPTIRDAEQIADVLMREGPRSQITQAATRMVEVLADEAAEKRLKDPLAYLFGVLSKGGLVGWLEKETKAERKKRESAELKAAVDEGRRMAEEGRR